MEIPQSHWHQLNDALTWIIGGALAGVGALALWFVRLVLHTGANVETHTEELRAIVSRLDGLDAVVRHMMEAQEKEHDVFIRMATDVLWMKDKLNKIDDALTTIDQRYHDGKS